MVDRKMSIVIATFVAILISMSLIFAGMSLGKNAAKNSDKDGSTHSSSQTDSQSSSEDEASSEFVRVEYTFRTQEQYDSHFNKHGKEFGEITKEEYLKKANDLIYNPSDTILHKTEAEDGDYIFYDTLNNEILFLSPDGYIRTYFRPDKGIEYYNKQ